MNRLLVLAAAVVPLLMNMSSIGFGADLEPDKAQVYKTPAEYQPQIVSSAFTVWSGCFAGANLGFDSGRWRLTETAPGFASSSSTEQSIAGGGQVGCDYQVGAWVFGFEAMLDGTGIRGSPPQPFNGIAWTENWFGTATGRIGYAITPPVLLYARGGAGFAALQDAGWTAGAGLEWKCLPDLSVFVEYDYLGFGNKNLTIPAAPVPVVGSYNVNIQTVLVGFNYRFNLGPPVTTRLLA